MNSVVAMDVWGAIDRRYEVIWCPVVMVERKWDAVYWW
jgi:hypothetical protein